MVEQTPNHIIKRVLTRAKEHVQDGNYDLARALVSKINHPKRDDWLANINAQEKQIGKVKPKNKNSAFKAPTLGPNWWAAMSIIMSPLISSIVLGWGWRRYGRKQWVLPTIVMTLMLLGLFIGTLVLTAAIVEPVNDGNTRLLYFLPTFIVASIFYTFPFFIAGRQNKALEVGKAKGQSAMEAHQYDWGMGVLKSGGSTLIIMIFAIGSFILPNVSFSEPNTFESATLNFEYPSNWHEINTDIYAVCRDGRMICEFAAESRFNQVGIIIVTPAVQVINSSTFIDNVWNDIATERIDRGIVKFENIDGRYATIIYEDEYMRFYALPKERHLLVVGIVTYTEEAMENNQENIEAIMNSLVYTP